MDSGLIGIAVAVGLNILVSAFSAGKLWQKVGNLSRDIERLEKKVENTDTHLDKLAERLAKIEGHLGL